MAIGKRREFEVFTLSFLDCICCGFGAIILLLVLTDVGQPIVIERSEKDLKGQIDALQRQLFDLRGETDVLNRELQGRIKEQDSEQLKAAVLAGDLSKIRGEFKASEGEASVTNKVEQELVAVHQTLTAEMERLLKNAPKRIDTMPAVGGIPVDSEWVIFCIDTSGSMQADNWDNMQNVVREILDIYPKLKGIQVLDDEGKPMFPSPRASGCRTRRRSARRSSRPWSTGRPTATRARSKASARRCRAGGPPTRRSACMSSATTLPADPSRRRSRRCANTTPWTARAAIASAFTPSACPMVLIPRRLSIRVLLL